VINIMASVTNSPASSDSTGTPSKKAVPRYKSILKSGSDFQEVCRYDRDGTQIAAKNHRITFADRVIKGAPIHIVYEVEQIIYPDTPSIKKSCNCICILF
jgi:hypothetical protein